MGIRNNSKYKFLVFFASILSIIFVKHFWMKSILLMPKEYKVLKSFVDQIAAQNSLGYKPISFSINSGIYTSRLGEEMGLCKVDTCDYLRDLNPYKKYKVINGIDIDELMRQSSKSRILDAYAWNGNVWISKSTFNNFGENKDFLGCIIAHELSHILFNNHIDDGIYLAKKSQRLSKKRKELLKYNLNRESEKDADNNSARLMINAGYPKDICLNGLKFITNKNKLKINTENSDTHPGYIERYNSLEKFISSFKKINPSKNSKTFNWNWHYNRNLNNLTFIPETKKLELKQNFRNNRFFNF